MNFTSACDIELWSSISSHLGRIYWWSLTSKNHNKGRNEETAVLHKKVMISITAILGPWYSEIILSLLQQGIRHTCICSQALLADFLLPESVLKSREKESRVMNASCLTRNSWACALQSRWKVAKKPRLIS